MIYRISSSSKVLVVGAHPDDEILGCGGTIARLLEEQAEVRVLTLTGATTSRRTHNSDVADDEMHRAMATLGVSSYKNLGMPDNRLDEFPLLHVIQAIETEVEEFVPDLVLTHDCGDLNIDHRITNQAVLTVFRPAPESRGVQLWAFESLSSSEWQDPILRRFQPEVYVNITGQLDKKLAAMKCYESELRAYPHPRSLEGIRLLAQSRGLEICREAAEAFRVLRMIL